MSPARTDHPATLRRAHRPRGVCALAMVLLAPFAAAAVQDATALAASAQRIEADVRFLADDLLEGRETGTRGFDIAALYVAARLRGMGLEPGGDAGSYFQQLPLLRGERDPEGARFAISRDGRRIEFRFESDFLPGINFGAGEAEVIAPMVFVGQGVHAPELQHDDLAGVDLKGRIAVMFTQAPARFANDQRAYHADTDVKLRELERRGAVGVISITDPVTLDRHPWERLSVNWRRPAMRVLDEKGLPRHDFPGLGVRVSLNPAQAAVLFEGSPHSAAEVLEMFRRGELRSFELAGTATLATRALIEPVASRNVIARLPGGDRTLATEHIVFTAHLDHLGIGVPVAGDAIYNGAMDNALGVSILLEAARLLAGESKRPRRSTLFIATTGEEKGLLGAEHFAASPTVPASSLVAEINMDMPLALGGLTDVVPIGIEHSSLEKVARRAVAEAGLELSPDPFPEEVVFVRSDQYPLVRAGVPAIYLDAGVKPADGSDGRARQDAFLRQHYHQPSDDLGQPIDWSYAARLARVNYRAALAIANERKRPEWNEGDFFGERFGRGAATPR